MTLDKFFKRGNKLAVFGSIIYSPEIANDIDFTIFTTNGSNPFDCSAEYSEEIQEFLNSRYGKLKVEFVGAMPYRDKPYNLKNLPTDDVRLHHCYLIGDFFPDGNFLENHYKKSFGGEYVVEPWLVFADHLENFHNMDNRRGKSDKDLLLIIHSTRKLIKEGQSELIPMVEKYERKYRQTVEECEKNKDHLSKFERRMKMVSTCYDLVPAFISEVKNALGEDHS